jgi:hypothetical protein
MQPDTQRFGKYDGMTPPNIPRLKHAIEVLEGVVAAKRAFDLEHWFTHKREDESKDEWCGTTACAMGYCALDKEFTDQGLRLVVDFCVQDGTMLRKTITTIKQFNETGHSDGYTLSHCFVEYETPEGVVYNIGWKSVAKFFSIDEGTAQDLFHVFSYPDEDRNNPRAVIAKIKHFISEHENA